MEPYPCIIFNPFARGEKARGLLDKIQQLALQGELRITQRPGEAEKLAAQAVSEGYQIIVAAGGDGTVNEVVNGISGANVTLGLLPVGTINVLALELGIPLEIKKAWEVIQQGHTRCVDLAKANERFFVQLAGVGIDAQIVSETDWGMKKIWGPLSYFFTGAMIAGRKPPRLLILTDDQPPLEGCFVLVGNGRFYGGPYEVFKGGRMDDGFLDVYVFQRMSHFDIMRYIQGIIFRSHDRLPDVKTLRVKHLRVESTEPVPVEVDGEYIGNLPVDFTILPGKLRVMAPATEMI